MASKIDDKLDAEKGSKKDAKISSKVYEISVKIGVLLSYFHRLLIMRKSKKNTCFYVVFDDATL